MDKLADGKDIENFEKIQKDVIKKSFDDGSIHEIKDRILNLRILIFLQKWFVIIYTGGSD